mgnify:CR=1 FL=1
MQWMATEASRLRRAGTGPGTEEASSAGRPDRRSWQLHARRADLRGNAGDLLAHLRAHWQLVLGLAAALLVGAPVVAWSGLYGVAATSRHYPFFLVFLSFARHQSVLTHTAGIKQPMAAELEDAKMRLLAAHYAAQGAAAPAPPSRRQMPGTGTDYGPVHDSVDIGGSLQMPLYVTGPDSIG